MVDSAVRFACPACGQPLTERAETLRCSACGATVPVHDDIPRFPVAVEDPAVPAVFDLLAPIYETPLWFPVVYRCIGGPKAPVDDRALIADLVGDADHVLDVACGTGRFSRFVARRAQFVVGIDVSTRMLRRAKRSAARSGVENVRFALMGAEALRFERDAFDGASCCWALHLFDDVPAALAEVGRVLRPGGRFAGATLGDAGVTSLPGVREWLRSTVGARVFAEDELRSLLEDAGFDRVAFERHGAALFFGAAAADPAS